MSQRLVVRPSAAATSRPSSARPSSATPTSSRWLAAGDAVVAAQRLKSRGQSTAVAVRGPEGGAIVASKPAPAKGGAIVPSKPTTITNAAPPGGGSSSHPQFLAKYGSAAQHAAKKGDAARLQQLIATQPGAQDWQDENKVTPLLMAAAYGHMREPLQRLDLLPLSSVKQRRNSLRNAMPLPND